MLLLLLSEHFWLILVKHFYIQVREILALNTIIIIRMELYLLGLVLNLSIILLLWLLLLLVEMLLLVLLMLLNWLRFYFRLLLMKLLYGLLLLLNWRC